MKRYVIAHVPHAATAIPADASFAVDLKPHLDLSTDWLTDELFASVDEQIHFPFSRLWCDVERLPRDPLEAAGRGAYTLRSEGGIELRASDEATRTRVLADYAAHHAKVDAAIQNAIAHGPVCLVDCHSFSDAQIGKSGPDFCIGTVDETPAELVDALVEHFKTLGYSVAVNEPYGGAWVPQRFAGNPDFGALMIEVNKRLYLDRPGIRSGGFERTASVISGAIAMLKSDASDTE